MFIIKNIILGKVNRETKLTNICLQQTFRVFVFVSSHNLWKY